MASEDWRKIDIDALEPENHLTKEELLPSDLPFVSYDTIQSVAGQIRSNLSSGQFQQALVLGLDNVPYSADEKTKELHSQTIFEVLCSIRNNNNLNDLSKFIKSLNSEQQDVLIKYLYKNMGSSYGQKQGGLLLNWFEKTVEVTGVGSIARYLTDRRTV
ncbi:Actin-related protein 2/3 complex subunit 5 [Candida maltosa Xu316]|uniref:Actin-related protein 2/3 complex subunit 5 n=1 Tax=Candida maltosa (strain Xu316) TaxID=1245528 RepID=M3IU46_CANMX|nr:Actin-related protein 2/3 complex subunit 5 [Candida maltosa Xu316]